MMRAFLSSVLLLLVWPCSAVTNAHSRHGSLSSYSSRLHARAHRPILLMWVNEQSHHGSHLVAQQDRDFRHVLDRAASQHDFHLTLPEFDSDDLAYIDQGILEHADQNSSVIVKASERYHPDIISVMNVLESDKGGFDTSANVLVDGKQYRWKWHTADVYAAGKVFIDRLTHLWSSHQVAKTHSESLNNTIEMNVTDIDSEETFDNIENYLHNLPTINKIQVIDVNDKKMTFRLTYSGDEAHLKNIISLNGVLAPTLVHEKNSHATISFRAVK